MAALGPCSNIPRSVNSQPSSFSEMLDVPHCGGMMCVSSSVRERKKMGSQLNARPDSNETQPSAQTQDGGFGSCSEDRLIVQKG